MKTLLDPRLHRLHFIGIGGVGMSGIAEIFHHQGYPVQGSDLSPSESTRRLESLGITIFYGHRPEQVHGTQVVVRSSAVKADNSEIVEARRLRIPVIPRAEMLGELLRGKSGIAVAGTHGKTTTTSMLGAIFSQAKSCQEDMDPTVIVGGKVAAFGGNARLGKSQWVIAEADESDGSFLLLPPTFALITNIDDDHLEYYGSMNKLRNAFQDFLGRIPFYGLAMLCGDDPGVRSILGEITKPFELYGFHPEWDWTMNRDGEVFYRASGYESPKKVGALKLRVPGRHNLLNALGAAALAYRLGISWGTIQLALENFQGAGRRFETRWRDEELGVWIVDDYGHHPTEILATLQAAKEMNAARIVTIFQPHRYSRTDQCFQGFRSAFSQTDVLVVTEIYGAGEEPIAGVDGAMLSEAIRSHPSSPREVVFLPDLETAARWVRDHHQRGDLTLTLGAGSITKLPKLIQMGWHDHRSS